MPVLTCQILPEGDMVDGLIGLCGNQVSQLRQNSQPIPAPVPVRMLLDTGADLTAVDPSVLAAFGLQPTVWVSTAVASHASLGVAPQYDISLIIVHPSGNPRLDLALRDFTAIELPLASLGHQVVIGRDILDRCLFSRCGPAGAFTLAY